MILFKPFFDLMFTLTRVSLKVITHITYLSTVAGTASDTSATRNTDYKIFGIVLGLNETEERLNTFRNSHLPKCPFIRIPETITARMLLEERPFL